MLNTPSKVNSYWRIATWNANGLISRKLELELFLEEHQVADLMVSETKLSQKRSLSMKRYKIFRKDRDFRE